MIEIEAPDGTVVEFPDNTPRDVMRSAMQRRFGNQQPTNAQGGQSYGLGMVDQFTQGAAMGLGDEITAHEAAILGRTPEGGWFDYNKPYGERYDTALAAERGQQAQFREENPVSATAAEIAGGVSTAVATPLGLLGAPKAGLTTLQNVGRGAAAGAGFGTGYGFNSGEGGFESRAASALPSGVVGALGGAAAVPLVKGGQAIYQRLARDVPGAKAAGLSVNNYRTLRDTVSDDLASGMGRMSAAGDDAMLADIGPGAAGLLDAVGQVPGGRQVAQANVGQRVNNAAQKTVSALDDALGRPGESSSRALTVYGDKTNPLDLIYRRAYSKPIDYASDIGRKLETLVNRRVPKDAIDAANRLMRVEGTESRQILAKVADDGTVVFERLPDVRQLDYITRGLNQVADSADGKGALGGMTPVGRAYANLSREIRRTLKEAVPEYKDALNVAADAIRTGKAREVGETVLSARVSRDDFAEIISDMGNAELRKVAEGVRMQIDDTMANVRRALTDTNIDAREAAKALGDLSTRANREKITALLGAEKAQRLFGQLAEADQAFQLRAAIAQNSKTAPRQLFNDANRAQAEEGVLNTLRQGRPVNAVQSLVQKIGGRSSQDIDRMAGQNAAELATALTGPRGAEARKLAQILARNTTATPVGNTPRGRLAQELVMRSRVGAGPLAERLKGN